MGKQLLIKPEKCVGCRSCEIVCSYYNRGKTFNPKNAAISVIMYEEAAISIPVMCLQCEEACCIKVCPVGAMYRAEDGTVKNDTTKCIVCKMCVNTCPLGNVSFSSTAKKVVKCELCDGDPACSKHCPTGCLVFSDDMDALGRKRNIAQALKDAYGEEGSK